MESLFSFLTLFALMLFDYHIAPKIIKTNRSIRPFIFLFVMVVGFAFIIADSITPTFKHETRDTELYLKIAMLVGYMIFSGVMHRKEVVKKMKFSYYFSIGCFTYVFIASGVMTYWLLPFSKFV